MLGVDPIEKKPFFHYHPGTSSLSISTVGCTFRCKFCQNYDISQEPYGMQDVEPGEVAARAEKMGCETISYTYNEPTVFFEYALDTAKEGLSRGIESTFVTNGYMTPEAVQLAAPYIQAMTVGIKGSLNKEFSRRTMAVPNPEAIKDALVEMKRRGIHVEITDLMVTKYGDDIDDVRALAKWIYANLGSDTPVHFTRFHPDWQVRDVPPTPVETLEKAHGTAREEGLRFVYVGNVPGHRLENTYCPGCGELLVERHGFQIVRWNIKKGGCRRCGESIPFKHSNGSGRPKLGGSSYLFGLVSPRNDLGCSFKQ
jgi:pyruvate formate lyase activating enzyme